MGSRGRREAGKEGERTYLVQQNHLFSVIQVPLYYLPPRPPSIPPCPEEEGVGVSELPGVVVSCSSYHHTCYWRTPPCRCTPCIFGK